MRAKASSRSLMRVAIAVLLALAGLAVQPLDQRTSDACAADPSARLETTVLEVRSLGMTVRDMERSLRFYLDVLTFEKVSDEEVSGDAIERLTGVFGARARIVGLRLGDEAIELTEFLAPRGRALPEDSRSNDLWFQHIAIAVSDMDAAYRRLRTYRVEHASSGPQRLPEWNSTSAGIQAFYFHDPDGHFLELIQFPSGKGNPKWQRSAEKLFLGVDHTAIVVDDTEACLKFYRDGLGMQIVGQSENYGTEQEHLNNVFGARLRITSLRPPAGPGVELLEYLAPRTGRRRPADAQPNDLLHWQTAVTVADADSAYRLLAMRANRLSSSVVRLKIGSRETDSFLLADPAGHVLHVFSAPKLP